MKIPILLKLLQSCRTKATPNFPNTSSRKGDQGFTLLEVLVTVLVLGILSSIAAPSWLAFINNQRVRTVNDRVLQSLRSAQSEAKRSKRDIIITFSATPVDPPTATVNTVPPQTPPLQTVTFDAGGEVKKGQITLSTKIGPVNPANPVPATPNSITFDYQGNLAPGSTPFHITVLPAIGGAKKCVIVETLLGGMRTDEGPNCL